MQKFELKSILQSLSRQWLSCLLLEQCHEKGPEQAGDPGRVGPPPAPHPHHPELSGLLPDLRAAALLTSLVCIVCISGLQSPGWTWTTVCQTQACTPLGVCVYVAVQAFWPFQICVKASFTFTKWRTYGLRYTPFRVGCHDFWFKTLHSKYWSWNTKVSFGKISPLFSRLFLMCYRASSQPGNSWLVQRFMLWQLSLRCCF